ncbi:MAG TPA: MBOAT family O-acyltransferase [Syntrophorhabdaceae bacterium]
MFFPQLVAGPIERPQHMLRQFREKHEFSYDLATNGIKLMAWGLFKKVVVADRLGMLVSTVYANPREFSGPFLVLSTFFFAFQIYCDFSGYSDIAIGSAQVIGFRLVDNFKRPYYAISITEFWRRWHISLSTWFRDYLYRPLGGNRVTRLRWCANILVTFAISGLWHGANWTFVVWGLLHGFYYLLSRWTQDLRKRFVITFELEKHVLLHKAMKVGITFCIVSFAWIFFVSKNLEDAFYVASHLFTGYREALHPAQLKEMLPLNKLGLDHIQLPLALLGILLVQLVEGLVSQEEMRSMLSARPAPFRWTIYYALAMGILIFGVFDNMKNFIYFQF